MKQELTQEFLKTILDYNSETGVVLWRERPLSMFKAERYMKIWNKKYAGKDSGTVLINNVKYYKEIKINNKVYRLSRIVWLYHYGNLPEKRITYADGDGLNLKINNLLLATITDLKNSGYANKKKSNLPAGVNLDSRIKSDKKYRATIYNNKKRIHLGMFRTPEEAYAAYVEAKRHISPEFCMI